MHPFDNDSFEREHFRSLTSTNAISEYRRLCAKLTGSLPSFAERGKPGRPRKAQPPVIEKA